MEEEGFRKFLKRGGRSKSAIQRVIKFVSEFEQYLQQYKGGRGLDDARPEDLEDFVEWCEVDPKFSVKLYMWGICYYYLSYPNYFIFT